MAKNNCYNTAMEAVLLKVTRNAEKDEGETFDFLIIVCLMEELELMVFASNVELVGYI